MGLRYLYSGHFRNFPRSDEWVRMGDAVDFLCCTTEDLWNEPACRDEWNKERMVDEIMRRFWGDVEMYNAQHVQREQRIAYATSGYYAFLCKKLPKKDSLVQLIRSFI